MPRLVFVDSSAFIARYLPDDQFHAAGVAEYQRLVKAGCAFVTSNYIFDEVVSRVKRRAGHARSREAGDRIREHPSLFRTFIDDELEDEAWRLHDKFADQPLTFTDVTCVAIMRRQGINEIFSFDSDFDRVGLVRLPAGR